MALSTRVGVGDHGPRRPIFLLFAPASAIGLHGLGKSPGFDCHRIQPSPAFQVRDPSEGLEP